MARVLVTGSSTGIGQAAAEQLIADGHEVVLHARTERRAAESALPGAAGTLIGDLASLAETKKMAENAGAFDTVVLNAGIGRLRAPERELTGDGLESTLQVNVLSAYLLTALLPRPRRLVFVSSAMAGGGVVDFDDPNYETRRWNGVEAYATTKLYLVMLAMGLDRRWPETASRSFDPGWVRTNMTAANGDNAPIEPAYAGARLARLAVPHENDQEPPDGYDSERAWRPGATARDEKLQDDLIAMCARLTGVTI